MPYNVKPNQEFLKFISIQGDKKKFQNLEMLLNLEQNNPGIFASVMANFDAAKAYRETLDANGKPIKLSWEEALKKYFTSYKYVGVTPENIDIAETFGKKGLSQEMFEYATKLRNEAKTKQVPENILDKPIKEETILESIERIKNETSDELINGRQLIEELYEKQFTYEWLSKNDPQNSIMGLLCSCCGTITSSAYGRDIAKSSIIAQDVQNLVIRNPKGEIISKGTMYINKDEGYAVINDFELNEKYRRHEREPGRYNVEKDNPEEQERELIFKAFQRGLNAFITEYDIQNPENTLKQINIGMGYNRLKKQVEQFKEATSNLTVPKEYNFQDATRHVQRILYKKAEQEKEQEIENGGNER